MGAQLLYQPLHRRGERRSAGIVADGLLQLADKVVHAGLQMADRLLARLALLDMNGNPLSFVLGQRAGKERREMVVIWTCGAIDWHGNSQ